MYEKRTYRNKHATKVIIKDARKEMEDKKQGKTWDVVKIEAENEKGRKGSKWVNKEGGIICDGWRNASVNPCVRAVAQCQVSACEWACVTAVSPQPGRGAVNELQKEEMCL